MSKHVVKGIERHPVYGAPDSPRKGESVGIIIPDADVDEIRRRLDDGEVLFLRGKNSV